jgi:osmotically-inducible protein OsmY
MTQELYPTSDKILRRKLLSRFASDNHTAFANLRVGVSNSIVHLAGVVASLEARVAAAEIAAKIPGVRGVVNRIDAPGAPSPSRTVNLNLQNDKGNTDE